MAESYTSRTGLIKPARDLSTPVDVEQINANMDKLDGDVGALMVTDGTIPGPTELYDGQIVKEITSNKVWIAQKQPNGTFVRKFIVWPYLYTGSSVDQFLAYGVYSTVGFITTINNANRYSLNSSAADNVGSYWVCPMKGVWRISIHTYWIAGSEGSGSTGFRYSSIVVNNTPAPEDIYSSDIVKGADFGGNLTTHSNAELVLNQGDTIASQLFQNAVPEHRYTNLLRASMLHPVS